MDTQTAQFSHRVAPIHAATLQTLMALPGISKATATAILRHRYAIASVLHETEDQTLAAWKAVYRS